MATITPTVLTADVWTKVLTNVTTTGKVVILDTAPEPTKYLVAIVTPTGEAAPAVDYDGGITFDKSFNISNPSQAVDAYVKPVKHNGKVLIFT